MLSSKGTETEENYESSHTSSGNSNFSKTKTNTKSNPYYIDVPIMLSLKGTLADNLALRAQAGPYFGFGLFGGAEYSYKYERYSNGIPDPNNIAPDNNVKGKVKNIFSLTTKEKEEFESGGLNRFT